MKTFARKYQADILTIAACVALMMIAVHLNIPQTQIETILSILP